jgi:hypothetical protein
MLVSLRSISLSCSLTAARAAAPRNLGAANRVRRVRIGLRTTGNPPFATGGDTLDGTTGAMAGDAGGGTEGIGCTLEALLLPLGLLIEPLSPRAFAGPGGMPLTPASWAGALESAASRPRIAALANVILAITPPQERIEPRCARLIG